MQRRAFPRQQVLLFAHSGDASTSAITHQLEQLGLSAQVVLTAGEVIWRLEDDHPFVAVIIDVDMAPPDRYELVAFLQHRHPALARLFIMTSPSVSELDGCAVADKRYLERDVPLALAA